MVAEGPRGCSLHLGVSSFAPGAYPSPPPTETACERDAEAMAGLCERERFATTLLRGPQATRAAVEDAMLTAARTLVAGDLLVLTFAGHGGYLPDVLGPGRPRPPGGENRRVETDEGGDDEAWCLWDGVVLDDRIGELLAEFQPCVRILVVSDSCYSGSILRKDAVDNAPPVVKASVILLAACGEDGQTFAGEVRGDFTAAVLEVWKMGRFIGSHPRFCDALRVLHPSAHLAYAGKYDKAFDDAPPFTFDPGPPARNSG